MSTDELNKKGISRRDLLKGAAGATVIAGGSILAGCSPKVANTSTEASQTEGQTNTSWRTPPEPIPASDIIDTIETDVVVVGAGVSGLSAAVSAKENGADVIVLEKGKTWSGRGGHFASADSRLMREAGITNDKAEIARQWIATCANRVNESMVWLYLNESGNAMDWFLDKADAAGLTSVLYDGYYRGSVYKEFPGTHMFVGGPQMADGREPGADVSGCLYDNAVEMGVTFNFETPGEQIVQDENGNVTGVIGKTADGYVQYNASRGVILATGDIGGNEEMTQELCPIGLQGNFSAYTPVGQNTGDGHRMALWAGGAFQDAPFPSVLHPLAFSWLQYYMLYVNQQGQRYMNEDTWVQSRSLNVIHQPGEGPWCFTVFDSNWPEYVKESLPYGGGQFWDGMGRLIGQEWTPDDDQATIDGYIEKGELGWKADTLDELAEQIGVPADNLKATVAQYNMMCEDKVDTDFGKRPELLHPVDTGPFYALKFGPALLVIVGGLKCNTKLQVLNENSEPIPGLYAVGNVAGDLYGNDYPTTFNGSSHGRALTWGYLAGKNVMES